MRAGRKSLQKDAPAKRKLCEADSACAEICEASAGAMYNMCQCRAKSRILLMSRHGSNVRTSVVIEKPVHGAKNPTGFDIFSNGGDGPHQQL